MKTAVDSNVLFDLLAGDPGSASAAGEALRDAAQSGALVICSVVYTELAVGFDNSDELSRFLRELEIPVEDLSLAARWSAAEAWKTYVRRRGQRVQCSKCGHEFDLQCPACHAAVAWRQHLISDFLIGGHAIAQAEVLLTRDTGYYRTYFPRLQLRAPDVSNQGR